MFFLCRSVLDLRAPGCVFYDQTVLISSEVAWCRAPLSCPLCFFFLLDLPSIHVDCLVHLEGPQSEQLSFSSLHTIRTESKHWATTGVNSLAVLLPVADTASV